MRTLRIARPLAFVRDDYVPDLPADDWQDIRDFVLAAVADASAQLSYPEASVMNAVAHHVDWCVNVAGYSLTRQIIFRRDIISAGALVMPSTNSGSRGQRRSLLLRVGEALGVIPVLPRLPPLAAASPSAPYTSDEVGAIIHWALRQPDRNRTSARVLVALSFGAGLPPRELCALRRRDISPSSQVVHASGRDVPVHEDWQDEVSELATDSLTSSAPLFRPTVA